MQIISVDDIGLETPGISQGFRELATGRSKRRSTNEQLLIAFSQRTGAKLDALHLKIFRLMSPRQQAALLEQLQ